MIAVLVAAILTQLLKPLSTSYSPLFLAAVAVSAWYGGLGPGFLATALSALALDSLFLSPVDFLRSGLGDTTRIGVFGLVALLIGYLHAARRQAEQELTRALAREQAARAEAEAANNHKDAFLTFLSHELRAPLTVIRNFVHILGYGMSDSKTLEDGRGLLERQVCHMSRLLDDLLDLSRIRCGKIELRRESLDLVHLLRATVDDQRPQLESATLAISIDLPAEPVWVVGDPMRLTQVITNLLGNAKKFTDPGGRILLHLTTTGNQWATLRVHDTGVGIEPEMLPHVFDMFAQAERTRDRSHGGLGFGLALVKGLLELHGGRVEAMSEGAGRGATFTVLLPLPRQSDVVDARAPAPPFVGEAGS
jgi:signal transduction histidine kinase